MPIYEYRCTACGKRASLFFRSIGAVDGDPACPVCGVRALTRRMSRVWVRSGSSDHDRWDEPAFEQDGVPIFGDEMFSGEPSMREGDDDEDVAEVARETRRMAQMMGEPLDAELDTALRQIERGADPDDVLGELDERAPEPADEG